MGKYSEKKDYFKRKLQGTEWSMADSPFGLLQVYDPLPNSLRDGLCAVVDMEFLEDIMDMVLYGLVTQVQIVRYFLICFPVRKELQENHNGSRMVIGRSIKPTLARELALDALLTAVWRCRPKNSVIVIRTKGVVLRPGDGCMRFCFKSSQGPCMNGLNLFFASAL